jgi:hypothetical protein
MGGGVAHTPLHQEGGEPRPPHTDHKQHKHKHKHVMLTGHVYSSDPCHCLSVS